MISNTHNTALHDIKYTQHYTTYQIHTTLHYMVSNTHNTTLHDIKYTHHYTT